MNEGGGSGTDSASRSSAPSGHNGDGIVVATVVSGRARSERRRWASADNLRSSRNVNAAAVPRTPQTTKLSIQDHVLTAESVLIG